MSYQEAYISRQIIVTARTDGVMVNDKPPIDEVIRKFRDFVGDAVLVGHNITSCDIPYITKAAKRAGVVLTMPTSIPTAMPKP